MEEKLYTTYEVSKKLGVTMQTVANNCKNGKLKCVITPGGHRRVSKGEVERFMKENGYAD